MDPLPPCLDGASPSTYAQGGCHHTARRPWCNWGAAQQVFPLSAPWGTKLSSPRLT